MNINKIHVLTKREIEHSGGYFNCTAKELFKLLTDKGAEIGLQEEENVYSDWTIDEESFKTAIKRIHRMNSSSLCNYFPDEIVELKDVVGWLEEMESIGDHRDGYYYFCWF